jgi:hypothetical protein
MASASETFVSSLFFSFLFFSVLFFSIAHLPYNHTTYTFNANLLHKILLINYCPDMFRPQFLSIFRELIRFCKLYVNTFCRFLDERLKL